MDGGRGVAVRGAYLRALAGTGSAVQVYGSPPERWGRANAKRWCQIAAILATDVRARNRRLCFPAYVTQRPVSPMKNE